MASVETEQRAPIRSRRVVAGILFIGLGISFLLESLGVWEIEPVAVWPLLLIALGTTMLVGEPIARRSRRMRSDQLAVAEERVRIARELHDIVAHGVSLMTIQVAGRPPGCTRPSPRRPTRRWRRPRRRVASVSTELRSMLQVLRGADASHRSGRPGRAADAPPDAAVSPTWATTALPSPVSATSNASSTTCTNAGLDATLTVSGEPAVPSPASVLAVVPGRAGVAHQCRAPRARQHRRGASSPTRPTR